jgi:hypothetical protein
MWGLEKLEEASLLFAQGLNDSEVARKVGVPRSTVRGWRGEQSLTSRHRRAYDLRDLPEREYSYLLGVYLGDGCISAGARAYRLRVKLDSAYPLLIDEVRAAIAIVMPYNRVGVTPQKENALEVYSYSNHWPTLLPQHGPGRKHLREIKLQPWQREIVERHPESFIRGLYHTDGCLVANKVRSPAGKTYAYPRYLFSNVSPDIKGLFRWACLLIGVESRPAGKKDVSVARRDSVARLTAFLEPKA